jgi:23S rRNA (uracil1939-C5)-methyltransferase
VPGDLVELGQVTIHKKLARAQIERLLEASPDRVEPRCVHFGRCGGCRWQHIDYSAQLDAKAAMVTDALERIGGLAPIRKLEVVASPDPYGYRARARLVEFEGGVGYRIRGSREVEKIDQCPVMTPAAQEALGRLVRSVKGSAESAMTERAEVESEKAVTDAQPSKSARKMRRSVEWILSAGKCDTADSKEAFASKKAIVQRIIGRREPKGDIDSIQLEVLGESLRVSSVSFMQGNALLWDALAGEVCRLAETRTESNKPKRLVELYAGIGFLTIPLARRGYSGIAIESDRSAALDLTFNLARNGLSKEVKVIRGRVEARRDLAKHLRAADLLVVDPPRAGLDKNVRATIASEGPASLIYVSCDPATLARDLKPLTAAGYELVEIRALDLFPQTPHIETVTHLTRPAAKK